MRRYWAVPLFFVATSSVIGAITGEISTVALWCNAFTCVVVMFGLLLSGAAEASA